MRTFVHRGQQLLHLEDEAKTQMNGQTDGAMKQQRSACILRLTANWNDDGRALSRIDARRRRRHGRRQVPQEMEEREDEREGKEGVPGNIARNRRRESFYAAAAVERCAAAPPPTAAARRRYRKLRALAALRPRERG